MIANTDPEKYQYNPGDDLMQAVAALKSLTFEKRDSKDEPNRPESDEATINLMTEISELITINAANAQTFVNSGGFKPLLELMIYPKEDRNALRKAACRLFASIVSNNKKMQDIATKYGAFNLAVQFEREKDPDMREAILASAGAYLKAGSFAGKRRFVETRKEGDGCDGIEVLTSWLMLSADAENKKFGDDPARVRRFKLKLLQLLYDLVLNDDSILNEGFFVRDTLGANKEFFNFLVDQIKNSDVTAH